MRTKLGTMIACAMKSEIVYAAYPFEVATGRYHLVLGLGSPLGLGLHFALHLPKARPYSQNGSNMDVLEGGRELGGFSK